MYRCEEEFLIILWFIDTGKWNEFAKKDHLLSSQLSVESFSSLVHLFIFNFSIYYSNSSKILQMKF